MILGEDWIHWVSLEALVQHLGEGAFLGALKGQELLPGSLTEPVVGVCAHVCVLVCNGVQRHCKAQ